MTEPTPGPSLQGGEKTDPRAQETLPEVREATPAVTPSLQGGGRGVGSSRRKFALAAFALVAVAVGVWYFAIYDREPADDLGRFQGEWQLAVPAVDRDSKPAARIVPVTIRVTGDRWVYVANGKEQRRYALTLRPEASPKELDLTMLGPDDKPTAFVIRGVYEVGGGRARVVAEPDPKPRPTALDDPNAETVWLLERVK